MGHCGVYIRLPALTIFAIVVDVLELMGDVSVRFVSELSKAQRVYRRKTDKCCWDGDVFMQKVITGSALLRLVPCWHVGGEVDGGIV